MNEESRGVPAEVAGIAERLREIAAELAESDLDEERAEQLAREAAELAGVAGNAVERALREAPDDR